MSTQINIEEETKQLDQLIAKLQKKDISLEESIKIYEEAMVKLQLCYKELDNAKGQIMDINTKLGINTDKEGLFND